MGTRDQTAIRPETRFQTALHAPRVVDSGSSGAYAPWGSSPLRPWTPLGPWGTWAEHGACGRSTEHVGGTRGTRVGHGTRDCLSVNLTGAPDRLGSSRAEDEGSRRRGSRRVGASVLGGYDL